MFSGVFFDCRNSLKFRFAFSYLFGLKMVLFGSMWGLCLIPKSIKNRIDFLTRWRESFCHSPGTLQGSNQRFCSNVVQNRMSTFLRSGASRVSFGVHNGHKKEPKGDQNVYQKTLRGSMRKRMPTQPKNK